MLLYIIVFFIGIGIGVFLSLFIFAVGKNNSYEEGFEAGKAYYK